MIIHVVARNTVKPDRVDEFIATAKKLIEATHREEGCIYYQLHQDIANPAVLTFIEQWTSKEALDAHMASPHFREIVPLLGEMDEKPSEAALYRKV
ncbi:MAG: antibiotic biosynthesis monooxygenase [Clostridia bacterium]|nr:antibiotic biosynthesis monooxygenase [Clostridia bacterium]